MKKIVSVLLFLGITAGLYSQQYTLEDFSSAIKNNEIEIVLSFCYDEYVLHEKQESHISGKVLESSAAVLDQNGLKELLKQFTGEITSLNFMIRNEEVQGWSEDAGWVFVFTERNGSFYLLRVIQIALNYEGGA